MKITIAGEAAKVSSGSGFSATTLAELPPGSAVEVLAGKKQDGKYWFSVKLDDGRVGFLPGSTHVSGVDRPIALEQVYAKSAPWSQSERADASVTMLGAALWLLGGIFLVALDFSIVSKAIESHAQQTYFPVKLALLIGSGAVLYGGVRLLIGIVAWLRSSSD